jgi:hypothetical protein
LLRAISRFGIATLGAWDPLKVAFSQEVVDLLDRAVQIAKSAGDPGMGVNHLLAAYANEEGRVTGELKRAHGIGSASWRAAVAQT